MENNNGGPSKRKKNKKIGPLGIKSESGEPANAAAAMPGKEWFITTQNSKRNMLAKKHSKMHN